MGRILQRKLERNAKVAAILVVAGTGLAGCGSLADIGGADITKATSGGLSAVLGVKAPDEQNREIVLRARSPLVLPPDYSLRPPVNPQQEEQQLGANWPVDPDVQAAEAEKARAAELAKIDEKYKNATVGRSVPLTPEELQQASNGGRPLPPGTDYTVPREGSSAAASPEELLRRHRDRTAAEQQAQAAAGQPQDLQAQQQAQAAQQQSAQQAAQQESKEEKGFFDRLVFWN